MQKETIGKRAKAGIYDDYMGTDINNPLISEDIVNGILDDVYNINLDKVKLDNKLDLDNIVNNIEKILKGD